MNNSAKEYSSIKTNKKNVSFKNKRRENNNDKKEKGKGLLDSLMKDLKHYKAVSGGVDARIELDKYFGDEFEDDTKEFNITLVETSMSHPNLRLVREYFFFIHLEYIVSKLVHILVRLQDWLRSE
ncbi:hypothetical protein H5410_026741 [Solanum commersonii]|uniref:Uncharacterized protein n=1 Tax=Solanum commersonii TaxID=4109 RepID=A0A9J5YXD3_SOLCO|nr:hypothetical protein H5410_026741 [Solanum commersonii]